jgi:hypothetical protein
MTHTWSNSEVDGSEDMTLTLNIHLVALCKEQRNRRRLTSEPPAYLHFHSAVL